MCLSTGRSRKMLSEARWAALAHLEKKEEHTRSGEAAYRLALDELTLRGGSPFRDRVQGDLDRLLAVSGEPEDGAA